jgi:sugar/nucleoside kinase (ribokinase family)
LPARARYPLALYLPLAEAQEAGLTLLSKASVFAVPVVPKEKIVDFIGSGDAFVGGFLAAFVQRHRHATTTEEVFAHHHLAQCVASGHFASSEVIQHAGCTFSSTSTRPPHDELGQ